MIILQKLIYTTKKILLIYVSYFSFYSLYSINFLFLFNSSYDLLNFTASLEFLNDNWGLDFKILNATDEDGVNSSMTDVFGVAATGLELIPPQQFMVRISRNF